MCGLEIEVENNAVKTIRGDVNDSFSRGHICPKAYGLKDIYEDKDRLKHPVRRTDSGWERISWEEAFDEVAAQIKSTQTKYGKDAVGVYLGNPNVHNLGSLLFGGKLYRALATKNRYSATSVDQLPHHLAGLEMFGNLNLLPVPDLDHTNYWIIMGGNPLVSNGSIMTAPDIGKRMKAVVERGKVVVIDPRKTETARKASEHHFVRPGSDVLVLLAMLQQIFANDWINLKHLEDLISEEEINSLQKDVQIYTPEKVAPFTGVSADVIKRITKEYCKEERAVLYGRMGVSVVEYGGLCQWLINCINILTGHFDVAGGAMFTSPAFDYIGGKIQGQKFDRWQSRVRKLPEFAGEFPSATLAEEILTEGEGQIKAMITTAGNPVLSTPNGKQLDKALEQLDFMVSIDIYINETTRHANIILPPATGLEVAHYDVAFHTLAIRNTVKYSEPLFEKEADTKYDYEIFLALQKRIEPQLGEDHPKRKKQLQFYHATPEILLDMGLRNGVYQLSLEEVKKHPHGIDLGALKTQLPERLCTEDKKISLFPSIYEADLERVKEHLLEDKFSSNGHLLLIGRRNLRSNNSWMHNSERFVKGRNQCTALLHPKDAKARDISNGQVIKVSSTIGQVEIEAELSEEMMPGVISIPHGWGHARKGVKLEVAKAHAGVSVNDLTDHHLVDALTGNAAVNGVKVEVFAT